MPTDLLDPTPAAPAEPVGRALDRLTRWHGAFSALTLRGAVYGPPEARRLCHDGRWVAVELVPGVGCGLPPSGELADLSGGFALAGADRRLAFVVRGWKLVGEG